MINDKDRQQIEARGSSLETVEKQLEQFKSGFPFADLVKAATIGDGILFYSQQEKEDLAAFFDAGRDSLKIMRFIPASGAATRMFKNLFSIHAKLQKLSGEEQKLYLDEDMEAAAFFARLSEFPFYKDLLLSGKESYAEILEMILGSEGLDFGSKPKGMLKFHAYDDGIRTAYEEHFHEAAHIAGNRSTVHLHFTVSEEHLEGFRKIEHDILPRLEKHYGCGFSVTYSFQKKETDTIAVTPEDEPLRDSEGRLVFRPGGHGALLENLNELDCDVLFINNIDNVSPDKLASLRTLNKKMLGGILLRTRDAAYELLRSLDAGKLGAISEAISWLKDTALLNVQDELTGLDQKQQAELLRKYLNRPVRVCGMVKNEGEAGGGPFFMRDSGGRVSLQIVEASQIDQANAGQMSILKHATHFNPVDLVCSIRNYKGNTFNLPDFIDQETGFISEKSVQGKDLKALELPGLWNGSMSGWITIFAEVPASTFTPVKTIFDLLREAHRA